MQFIVIKGSVVGGHRINDLGLTVPYQKEVRVPADRAGWSSDFAYAVKHDLIEKVREVDSSRLKRHQAKRKRRKAPKKPEKKETKSPKKGTIVKADKGEDSQVKELREMNQKLLDKLDTMTESQQALMQQMALFLDQARESSSQGVSVDQLKEALGSIQISGSSTSKGRKTFEDSEDDEDTPMYIPSQIRSKKTKVSEKMDVEEGTSKGDSLDAASELLSSMRKSKKSKGSSDE